MSGEDPTRSPGLLSSLSNVPARLLRENLHTPESVPRFEQKLFFEGARRRSYLERFWVLLILAVVIATMGLLGDSTATVIGAMIVAPLMTPIMATAAALVMGRLDRAVTSGLLVLAGVAAVIGLGWLIGLFYSGVIDFTTNSQLAGRISPRAIDLVAALASGAAGAFCMSREDIANSLPGVAIAISLVPPLCVVGLALSVGEWGAASGALLLFVTNALAILLAGGGVLAALGLARASTGQLRGNARRNAFIVIALGVALVAVPLIATGRTIARNAIADHRTRQVARVWTAGTGYVVRQVQVSGDTAAVLIDGTGVPPSASDLALALAAAEGRPMSVVVDVIPAERQTATSAGGNR